MYAEIYRDLDQILSQDDTDAFWDALSFLLGVPRLRRTCFYFHTFTRKDGRDYRVAFLTLHYLRVLASLRRAAAVAHRPPARLMHRAVPRVGWGSALSPPLLLALHAAAAAPKAKSRLRSSV
jgi:hypothetical protein